MKLNRFKRAAFAVAIVLTGVASTKAVLVVGSGADISHLVIEASEFGAPLEFEYHYTFNAGSPIDAYAMLTAVDAADPNLSIDFLNYGTSGSPNYFLDTITFKSITLDSFGEPFWAQWVSGGKSGYPTATSVASGAWSEGSGISNPYRQLAPGSWDGFIHNGATDSNPPYGLISAPPSVSPVPEPSTFALLGLSVAFIGWTFRRRNA